MRQSALSGRSGEAGSYRNGIISRSANGPDTVFSHQNANAPEARYAEGGVPLASSTDGTNLAGSPKALRDDPG